MNRRIAILLALPLALAGCKGPAHDNPSATAQEENSHSAIPEPKVNAVKDHAPTESVNVELTLSKPAAVAYPVSSGIPFARGSVTSLVHLRLDDASGQAVPAQFTGLARWPDGSYKSVLVTFIAPAGPNAPSYVLHSGPEVAPAPIEHPLTLTDESDRLTVTTGPMRFAVNKARFTVIEQAWVDADRDGQFAADEALLGEPGDIFLTDATDGAEYRASRFGRPQVSIEESGPLRAVVRVQGSLQSENGRKLTEYIVRLTAYAGQETLQMDYTLVDTREEKDVEAERKRLALAVSSYGIRMPVALKDASGLFAGENGQVYAGPATGDNYLYQRGETNYIDGSLQPFGFSYEGVGEGAKSEGWVDVSSPRAGVTAMVRKFWQQFPKEMAVSDGRITVSLHPLRASGAEPDTRYPRNDPETKLYRRPNTFYFPREGGAKTYQMLFAFHAGAGSWSALRDLSRAFDEPPRALATPAWYCNSGVFGDLTEAGPWTEGYDAWLIDGVYQRSIGDHKEDGALAMLYGWRDYGDRMRPGWAGVWDGVPIPGFYNDTHVGAHIFFIQFLRTLDEIWWELGEMSTRHCMDIDISHANRLGYWKRNGKPVGFGPGELHAIKHEMIDHDSRNLHKGHAHLSGLPDYYLLTGDRRALEVLNEVGNWWVKAAPVLYPTPVGKPHWAEAERDFAWPLFTTNEAYRATGDIRYLKASAQIAKHVIEWWQTPSEHYVNGKKVGDNDWRRGTGWWYMYPKQDNSPEPPFGKTLYNGTNPWMAGPLIASLITFKKYDQDTRLIDASLLQEMLLQTMNFVVKYGWEQDKGYFIYSEAARDTGGSANLIVYALAYLAQVYQKGGLAHPEWYDSAPTWMEIAAGFYNDWKVVKDRGTTDMGFYGYEMIFTPEFFTIMRRMEEAPPGGN